MLRGLVTQIQRLADGFNMSADNFPHEGVLPCGGRYRALKRIPLRAYCWLSKRKSATYYISHYVYKDFDKLKRRDTDIVCDNWKRVEVDNRER